MASKKTAKRVSLETRVAALEHLVRDLTNALAHVRALKDKSSHLPVMPKGSGLVLAVARRKAGWSGEEVAKAIGMSKAMLSLWETERREIPTWRAELLDEVWRCAGLPPPAWPKAPTPSTTPSL